MCEKILGEYVIVSSSINITAKTLVAQLLFLQEARGDDRKVESKGENLLLQIDLSWYGERARERHSTSVESSFLEGDFRLIWRDQS